MLHSKWRGINKRFDAFTEKEVHNSGKQQWETICKASRLLISNCLSDMMGNREWGVC